MNNKALDILRYEKPIIELAKTKKHTQELCCSSKPQPTCSRTLHVGYPNQGQRDNDPNKNTTSRTLPVVHYKQTKYFYQSFKGIVGQR